MPERLPESTWLPEDNTWAIRDGDGRGRGVPVGQQGAVGIDANGQYGLWVTDGTAAGTRELSGISGQSATGLHPVLMVALGGKVLFNGLDANGHYELWVTNSTVAGTHELSNIPGESSNGLDPQALAVVGNQVLFSGVDSSGNTELWVTNGTVAGTHELKNIPGESAAIPGLSPSFIAALSQHQQLAHGLASFITPNQIGQLWSEANHSSSVLELIT
jgi:ELWxxDGT repeat protein